MDSNYPAVQPVELGGVPPPRLVPKDVFSLYTSHFRRWFAVTAPTSVLASVVLLLADRKISEIFRSFPITQVLNHKMELAEAGVLRYGSFFTSWFLGCLALAAIATVVSGLDKSESHVWISDSFQRAREHFAPLFLAAVITFGIFLVGMAVFEFIVLTLGQAVGWARFSRFNTAASLISVVVVASIVSWFSLTIPLVLAEDIGVWAALRRSLKISNGYEGFLSALVLESMAGSYVSWYAVHYGFTFLLPAQLRYTVWYGWLVYFVTILASAAVQPPMFIGFSLLAAHEHSSPSSLPRAQHAPHID